MLMLPDPLYRGDQLGAAAVLWFNELTVSLPPQVVTRDSFAVLGRLESEEVPWQENLKVILGGWASLNKQSASTLEALADIRDRIKVVWFVYNGDLDAMTRAGTLIRKCGLTHRELLNTIDLWVASAELTRHLFLERWLEVGRDPDAFWTICGDTLNPSSFDDRLVEAYLLRLAAFKDDLPACVLSNPRLLDFIWRCWEISGAPDGSPDQRTTDIDVVGYEVFRHLVSPRLDPMDSAQAVLETSILMATKPDEIAALRRQCLRLAEKVADVPLPRLESEVATFIELHVQDELAALLNMNERSLQDYLEGVMSDRGAWIFLLSSIAGAASGSSGFTIAGGIGVVATLLSKGVATKFQARKDLRDNPYRFIRSTMS
jgi:hypothetical protein